MSESIEQITPLEAFRREIRELKTKEQEAGNTVHFRELNPDNLTEEDLDIYNKFKNETLELPEFRDYRHRVCNIIKNKDSCDLAAFLANTTRYWLKKSA